MKTLMLTAVLFLSVALTSYGKTESKKASLFKSLNTALQNSQTSSTSNYGDFKRTSFAFNEKMVSAYFDAENDNLIGFGIPMSANDLPAGTLEAMQKKYSQYSFQEAIMFISEGGSYGWYVSMTRAKKPTIVLTINTKGKVHYYTRM